MARMGVEIPPARRSPGRCVAWCPRCEHACSRLGSDQMKRSRLPHDFATSAAYAVHAIDVHASRAQMLHFNADDYRRASFLDARALGHREIPRWIVSLDELGHAAPRDGAPVGPHLLFHLGHVGSTLVSRLLDLLPEVLGLREPLPLLPLLALLALAHERTHAQFDTWLPLVRRLLARPLDTRRTVIVKPTSVVTAIAAPLLAAPSVRACLLDVDLSTWMASMLRDPGLVQDALASEAVRGIAACTPAARVDAWRPPGAPVAARAASLEHARRPARNTSAPHRIRRGARRPGAGPCTAGHPLRSGATARSRGTHRRQRTAHTRYKNCRPCVHTRGADNATGRQSRPQCRRDPRWADLDSAGPAQHRTGRRGHRRATAPRVRLTPETSSMRSACPARRA